MIDQRHASLVFITLTFAVCGWLLMPNTASNTSRVDAVASVMQQTANKEFAIADHIRTFEFPRDHGAHAEFRNEWWYFTGHLATDGLKPSYGFQLTFFRYELDPAKIRSKSPWRTQRMILAHFAITDLHNQQFHAEERLFRAIPAIAGIENEPLKLWLDNWSIQFREEGEKNYWLLHAATEDLRLELRLDADSAIVLQGDRGLSQKGPQIGAASYYYSMPSLAADGIIAFKNKTQSVQGEVWLDREWSTSALDRNQQGWDWFALHLPGERALMFYQLRNNDGSKGEFSGGTLSHADGSSTKLAADDVVLEVRSYWTSEETGIRYPSRWRLKVPAHELLIDVQPHFEKQEWTGRFKYWEGSVKTLIMERGENANGHGYVELTGYQ